MLRRDSNLPRIRRTGIIIGSVIITRKFESGEPFVLGIQESMARANISICNARTQAIKTCKNTGNSKSSFHASMENFYRRIFGFPKRTIKELPLYSSKSRIRLSRFCDSLKNYSSSSSDVNPTGLGSSFSSEVTLDSLTDTLLGVIMKVSFATFLMPPERA